MRPDAHARSTSYPCGRADQPEPFEAHAPRSCPGVFFTTGDEPAGR